MAQVWTLARWVVTPGKEAEFVPAWQDLADWTVSEFPAARGTLLRDQDAPNVFVSFGPWRDLEQAQAWRTSDGFGQRVARLREFLNDFQPHLLDQVRIVGQEP